MADTKLILRIDNLAHKLISAESEIAFGETFDIVFEGLENYAGKTAGVYLDDISGTQNLWGIDAAIQSVGGKACIQNCVINTEDALEILSFGEVETRLSFYLKSTGYSTYYGDTKLRLHPGLNEDGEEFQEVVNSVERHNEDTSAHQDIRERIDSITSEVADYRNEAKSYSESASNTLSAVTDISRAVSSQAEACATAQSTVVAETAKAKEAATVAAENANTITELNRGIRSAINRGIAQINAATNNSITQIDNEASNLATSIATANAAKTTAVVASTTAVKTLNEVKRLFNGNVEAALSKSVYESVSYDSGNRQIVLDYRKKFYSQALDGESIDFVIESPALLFDNQVIEFRLLLAIRRTSQIFFPSTLEFLGDIPKFLENSRTLLSIHSFDNGQTWRCTVLWEEAYADWDKTILEITIPDSEVESDLTFAFSRWDSWNYSVRGLSGRTSFTVDWGDGLENQYELSTNGNSTAYPSHTYKRGGIYHVKISNDLESFLFVGNTKITRLIQWGEGVLYGNHYNYYAHEYFMSTFANCTNLRGPLPPFPPGMKKAFGTFNGCKKLDGFIPKWPSEIIDVRHCYRNCVSLSGVWGGATDEELMPDTEGLLCANCVTGASSDLAKYFTSDWGGTKTA